MKIMTDFIAFPHGWWKRIGSTMIVIGNKEKAFLPKGFRALKEPYFYPKTLDGFLHYVVEIEGWSSGVVIHPDKYYQVTGIQFGFANSITVKAKARARAEYIAIQDFQFSTITDVQDLGYVVKYSGCDHNAYLPCKECYDKI